MLKIGVSVICEVTCFSYVQFHIFMNSIYYNLQFFYSALFIYFYLQLSQVDTTLSTTLKGPDRDNLLSLKSDIEELISLTKESLQNLEGNVENKNENDNPNDKTKDLLDREYALFKVYLRNNYSQRIILLSFTFLIN